MPHRRDRRPRRIHRRALRRMPQRGPSRDANPGTFAVQPATQDRSTRPRPDGVADSAARSSSGARQRLATPRLPPGGQSEANATHDAATGILERLWGVGKLYT